MSEIKYLDQPGLQKYGELLKAHLGVTYVTQADYDSLSDRVEALENAPSNDVNVKKQTLQLYHSLGESSSTLKPLTDELRSSMIGLPEFASLGTGLFIHWGIYAVPAGNYTGEKQAGSTVTATSTKYNCEWIMRDLAIPRSIYKAYESQFTSENWDPETLCRYASEAGMGYVVICAKHHDGFVLYPTAYGDWDVTSSGARPTILDELKAACDKYKLKFGLYISHYWDWMAEGGFGLNYGGKWNGSSADLYTADEHKAFLNREALMIDEMIKKYDPFILWYDPGTNYGDTYCNILRQAELSNWPHVITNDRLDYNRKYGDYGTGERTIYIKNTLPVGEACFTMNNTWGYSDNNESMYYSHEKVFKEFIIYSLAYGQNCLMNIGPKADGSIPTKQIECLESMNAFFTKYGFPHNYKRYHSTFIPKFGYILELPDNKLVCYVVTKGNPTTQDVTLDCVPTENLSSVRILTPGEGSSYEIVDGNVVVHNLALDSDTKIGVVELNYSKTITPTINKYYSDVLIPSRVFIYNYSGMSWDIANLYYKLKPSAKVRHMSKFIWAGESGQYTLELNRTRLQTSPIAEDDVTTVTITDANSTVQSVTYAYDISKSATSISLKKGATYSIELQCIGAVSSDLYRLDGFTFTPEVIIIHPESVTLDAHELFVDEEGTGILEATVLPIDTTNPEVVWASNNTDVATVDQDGIIHGVAAGDATVTVTTVDGNKADSCHVIVTGQSIIHATGITLNETTKELTIGETATLSRTITPTDATYPQVQWSSSDESIVTVDNYGLITAVSEGNATITCELIYDQLSATCALTVHPIHPESISLNKDSITLLPGYSDDLEVTFTPSTTTHKDVTWSIDDPDIATVSNGHVFAKAQGTATITATSVDGGKIATCALTVSAESYDHIFEANSLDGSTDQGTEWNIHLFGDDMPNWTLFGYAKNSRNTPNEEGGARQTDNNATLYQCVVNASPWSGLRADADNNNYPTTTTDASPLLPRLLAGTDCYINPITGVGTTSKQKISPTGDIHPVYITRNGSTYKYSIDGVNWTEFTGLTAAQLTRLQTCIITIGYDYKRQNGQITNTKYRFLRTDYPVCVAIKETSDYRFYTLHQKYHADDHAE